MTTTEMFPTEYNDLFAVIENREPEYLRFVELEDISWSEMGDAKAILGERYQTKNLSFLAEAPNGLTLEVVGGCAGQLRSDYCADAVILRLVHCHFIRRWIPDAVPRSPDKTGLLTLYAEIECELQLKQ